MEPSRTSVSSDELRVPNAVAVVPAHNERRFIGSVVIEVLQYVDTVIVIDDGSSDGTGHIAEQAGAVVLRNGTNLGKAKAVELGLQKAQEFAPSVIVMLDGDGQHRPDEIPTVIRPVLRSQADMVIGSRFQGTDVQVPLWRQFGQHALTYLTNFTSGSKSSDSQSGFRAFSPQKLQNFAIRTEGFSIESEMQFWATEQDIKIEEVPINCLYDEKPKRNPVTHGLEVINGIFKLVSESRPLFYFGVIGSSIMLLGLIGWWWTLAIYAQYNEFALGTGLVSTLITLIGLATLFQGITLNSLRKVMEKQAPTITTPTSASSLPTKEADLLTKRKNHEEDKTANQRTYSPSSESDTVGSEDKQPKPDTTVKWQDAGEYRYSKRPFHSPQIEVKP